jgi:thiosulfate oxidation carrier complex protein SoxZ
MGVADMHLDIGDARIRLPGHIEKGQEILVHAIVQHPMHTGFFRSAGGEPIPAWFIRDVTITYAGDQVARFKWTSGISRDPVISFTLIADREGPLTIRWVDSKDAVFEKTAPIAFSTT